MRRFILLFSLSIVGIACRDLTSAKLPAGVKSAQEYETREGALALYRGAIGVFRQALLEYLKASAVFTDEYTTLSLFGDSIDLRRMPSTDLAQGTLYSRLHKVRGQAQQALGTLTRYASDVSPALRAHLFAIQGYTEIFLADLYCSGIPLSTVDFDGDFTYQSGSPTEDVYKHALTLFDSALTLSGDSISIEHLARIGKARVLLQLARYQEAAEVITSVPVTYRYSVRGIVVQTNNSNNYGELSGTTATISNLEGMNGLPYRNDPRVDAVFVGNSGSVGGSRPIYSPRKYLPIGTEQPIVIASGVEAQLIQAEADLHAGRIEQWLERLNMLRTDGTYQVNGADTIWGTGLGAALFTETPAVAAAQRGLPPLTDPAQGTMPPGLNEFDVRVNLLFAERAYWLFQTGQRQGDLRRLVREYGRRQETVYPSGISESGATYGRDVTFPITMTMEGANPYFKGCIHRDA